MLFRALLLISLTLSFLPSLFAQIHPTYVLAVPAGITDVQMTGTASWHLGSDEESGSVTLDARLDGKSRLDLQFTGNRRSEIRVWNASEPQVFNLSEGTWTQVSLHNTWTDPNWFLPQFSALTNSSSLSFVLNDYGNGHIRAQRTISGVRPYQANLIQVLSTVDYQIDISSGLLNSMRWLAHPDDDFGKGIPVEIDYSDYRQVSGLNVPFHIQRYVNGTLQLDITISGVKFNTGLSDSDFTANN